MAAFAIVKRMGRARTILQSEFPYNIGGRCINREWFNIPMPIVWEVFCAELTRTSRDHELLIHSFILMSNHYHLVASTPRANISECLHQFSGRTSRQLNTLGNRINQTFAGRTFKCVLHSHNYYLNAYKYNYRNPIKAGICERVEEYPYSTLRGLLNPSELLIPLAEDSTFKSDPQGTLNWLNTTPDEKKLEAVKWALKRPYFKSKNDKFNKPMLGEDDIL